MIFAALVAIGLVGEYRKDKNDRWKGLSDTFELLVIIGVVGEVIFDGLIFGFSGRLSVIQDQAVETATDRSTQATNLARQAIDRATEAIEKNKVLEINIETVRNDNLQIARILARIDKKQAELRRRTISTAQQQTFINATKDLTDKPYEIPVLFSDGDDDSTRYADEIVNLLRKAGFRFAHVAPWHGSPPVKPGVTVCLKNSWDNKIFDALKLAKIATEGARYVAGMAHAPETMPELREGRPFFCDNALIFVGLKPATS